MGGHLGEGVKGRAVVCLVRRSLRISDQIQRSDTPPFGLPGHYTPLQTGDKHLYRAIREAVPLVDACIYKIIRLCGGVSAECDEGA